MFDGEVLRGFCSDRIYHVIEKPMEKSTSEFSSKLRFCYEI